MLKNSELLGLSQMTFVSYAQNFEDVILKRALSSVKDGFYIDVGACDPVHHSVTKSFYELGWSGINVEPLQHWFDQLEKDRPRDKNIQAVLTDEIGEIDLYSFPLSGLSTTSKDIAEKHESTNIRTSSKVRVVSTTFDTICHENAVGEVHFLKIDVEGAEKAVLQGSKLSTYRPWIILLECVDPFTQKDQSHEWRHLLLERGYIEAYFDGLNKFYIAQEKCELLEAFKLPPNIFDGFVLSQQQQSEVLEPNIDEGQISLKQQITSKNREIAALDLELNAIKSSKTWRRVTKLRSWNERRRIRARRTKARTQSQFAALKAFPATKIKRSKRLTKLANSMKFFRQRTTKSGTRRASFSPTSAPKLYEELNGFFVERFTFIYVEHTAAHDLLTGVQQVCHKLVANMFNHGEHVFLVKLDKETLQLAPLDEHELQNFQKQTGRVMNSELAEFYQSEKFGLVLDAARRTPKPSWLIIPEVTYHTTHAFHQTSRIIKTSRDFGLRVGAIYYDTIPFEVREASENNLKHANYTSCLATADVIWPISKYAHQRLIDFYEGYEQLTVDEMPQLRCEPLATDMETRRQFDLQPSENKLILSVGTINEQKNQITSVRAFNAYCKENPETDWRYVLVGLLNDTYRPTIENAIAGNPRIQILENASNDEVSELYRKCSFTIFSSQAEGFGLPVVESLWNGKPCICAPVSALKELIEGGGCVSVDTTDAMLLKSGIEQLTTNRTLYDSKVDEIIRRPIKSWSEYCGNLINDMDRFQYGKAFQDLVYYWVDATVSAPSNTGIQRVNRQLAKHLIEIGQRLVPIKWDDEKEEIVLADEMDLLHLSKWNGPSPTEWQMDFSSKRLDPRSIYLMVDLPLNRSLNVQEKVIETFENSKVKTAAVFYDAIPYLLKEIYPANFSAAHEHYMQLLDRMDRIFPISVTSGLDLIEYLTNTSVRGLALEHRVRPVQLPSQFPESERLFKKDNIEANSVCEILSVGTVEPRKNHLRLIEAFLLAEKKSSRALSLTIIGSGNSFDKTLSERVASLVAKSKNINWIQNADDDELSAAFEKAEFTVYPSFEEGFGLPVVESLWFGAPCICSDKRQIAELAVQGGCLQVDVMDVNAIAEGIVELANNVKLRCNLLSGIMSRHFRSWAEYAAEISGEMQLSLPVQHQAVSKVKSDAPQWLPNKPFLSICITTYNRAGWLDASLKRLKDFSASFHDVVEIVVCDNASTDRTPEILQNYKHEVNFRCFRNSGNIGMLGNLPQTASLANGEYVWLIGDDDLIHESTIANLVSILRQYGPEIVNLNYAYTPKELPKNEAEIDIYLENAQAIGSGKPSQFGLLKDFCSGNENYFTAIYSFIVKKKHAQQIFCQDTSGAPFSELKSCVPSSNYILRNMLELPAFWVNEPQLTINMNVSWGKYAHLWVLERVPEVYDLAEVNGVATTEVDKWRKHTMKMFTNYFSAIFETAHGEIHESFDLKRCIRRFRHLDEFNGLVPQLEFTYANAKNRDHPLALMSLEDFRDYLKK